MNVLTIFTSIPKKHFFIMGTLLILLVSTKVYAANDIVYIGANQTQVYGTGAAVNSTRVGLQVDNFGGKVSQSEQIKGVVRKYNVLSKPVVTSLVVNENQSATKYTTVEPGVYQAGAIKPTIYPFNNQASGRVAVF